MPTENSTLSPKALDYVIKRTTCWVWERPA